MAILSLIDAYVSIGGNVVSTSVKKVTLDADVVDLDSTTMGGGGWTAHIGGLKSGKIDIDFLQDYAAAALDSIFWPLLGTVAAFEIRGTSSTVGASNPKWTGSLLISKWSPVNGTVGDLAVVSVSFPTTGTVTRAVA